MTFKSRLLLGLLLGWGGCAVSFATGTTSASPNLAAASNGQQVVQQKGAGQAATIKPININTADAKTLQTIKGIGPSRAKAIVEEREKRGAFKSLMDLTRVRGMSEPFIRKIQKQITVD